MPRNRKSKILVPVVVDAPVLSVGQSLEQLIERKVQEALQQQDGLLLEPWFRTAKEAHAIRRLQYVPEQKKCSMFFDKHGCLRCGTKKRIHQANGMCNACNLYVRIRLKKIIRELSKERR